MLEQALKNAIPSQLPRFRKLTEGHDPYYFESWDQEDGAPILRYWFWDKARIEKIKKRVFIGEVEELLNALIPAEGITPEVFLKHCPRTMSDGECSFAVTMRMLEYFQVIEVAGDEYLVKSPEKIQELLSHP